MRAMATLKHIGRALLLGALAGSLLTACQPRPVREQAPAPAGLRRRPPATADSADGMELGDAMRVSGLKCFECHNALSAGNGIRFSHAKHNELAHCTTCHGPQDHQKKPADAPPHTWGVSRSCMQCHDGVKAPDGCRYCHQDESVILPESHQEANFVRTHGRHMDDTQNCGDCHEAKWCRDCHGVDLPHPRAFLNRHGAEYLERPKVCGQCHAQTECRACHNGLDMPHPKPFIQGHGDYDQRLCGKCHARAECMACHRKRNPHPAGFVKVHGEPAVRGASQCSACHTQAECDRCHGGFRMPHPDNFERTHGPSARRNSQACLKCHQRTECDSCHGLPMPHPANYLAAHDEQARQNRTVCGRCHTERWCDSCHGTRMPHPEGYVLGHNGEATFGEKSRCAKCHEQAFCGQCHTQEAVKE